MTTNVYCDEHDERLDPKGRCFTVDYRGHHVWHRPDILDTYVRKVVR